MIERQDVDDMEQILGELVGGGETATEPLEGPGFGHTEAETDSTEAENGPSNEHTEREESTADATTGMESAPPGKGEEEEDPDHRAKFLEALLLRISDLEKPASPGPPGALPPRVTGASLPPFDWQTYDPKNTSKAKRNEKNVSQGEGEMTGWMRRWMMRPPYGGLDAVPPGGANSHPEFPPGRDHGLTARESAWFGTMHRRAQERQRPEGAARRGLGEGLGARQGFRAGSGANGGANPRAGPGLVDPEDRLSEEEGRQEAGEGFLFADSAEEELGGRGGFVGGPERGQTESDLRLEIRRRRPARPQRDPRESEDLSDCEVMEWQRKFNREWEAQGLGESPREPANPGRALRERRERRSSEKAAGASESWGEDSSGVSGQGSRVRLGGGGMRERPGSPPCSHATNPRNRPRGGLCFLGPESEDELFGFGARRDVRGPDKDQSDPRRRDGFKAMLEHRERERRGRVNSASENRGGAGVAGGPAGEPGDDDSSDDDSGEEEEFPGSGKQGFGEQVSGEQGLGDQHSERPSVNASGEQWSEVQGLGDQVLGGRGLEGQGFLGLELEKQRPGGPSLRDQAFTSLEGDQGLERQGFCGMDSGRGYGNRSLGSSGLEGRDSASWDWEEQDQGSQGVRMQNSGGKGSGSHGVEILEVETGELDRGLGGLGVENAGSEQGLGGLGVENGGLGGGLVVLGLGDQAMDQGLAETGQEHITPVLEDWGYESLGALDLDQEDWSGRFNTAGLDVPGGRGAILEGGLEVPPQSDDNRQRLSEKVVGDLVRAVGASQDGPVLASAFDAPPDTSTLGKSHPPPASGRRPDALTSATARNVNTLPGAGQSMSGASPVAEAGGDVRGADVSITSSAVGADEAFEEMDAFVQDGEPQAEPGGAALDTDAWIAPSEQRLCQAEALGESAGGSRSPAAASRWSYNFQQEMEDMRRQASPILDLKGLRSFSQSQKSFFQSRKESDDAKAEQEGGKGTGGPNLSAGEEGWLKWKAWAGSVSGKSPGKKRVKMLDHGKG
jgi:hypothetical protein